MPSHGSAAQGPRHRCAQASTLKPALQPLGNFITLHRILLLYLPIGHRRLSFPSASSNQAPPLQLPFRILQSDTTVLSFPSIRISVRQETYHPSHGGSWCSTDSLSGPGVSLCKQNRLLFLLSNVNTCAAEASVVETECGMPDSTLLFPAQSHIYHDVQRPWMTPVTAHRQKRNTEKGPNLDKHPSASDNVNSWKRLWPQTPQRTWFLGLCLHLCSYVSFSV